MADVEFKVENSVLWITLNRPEQMGALTSAMRDEIIQRLLAARTEVAVRAAVLTGKGKGFCTGADLSRPAGAPASTEPPMVGAGREMMKYGSQLLLRTIWEFEKPFLAAVNGTVIADRVASTMGPNGSRIDRIMMNQLYSGSTYPIYQWVDDVQVWSTFPSAVSGQAWYDPPYAPH